jgi:hypothetical protein
LYTQHLNEVYSTPETSSRLDSGQMLFSGRSILVIVKGTGG